MASKKKSEAFRTSASTATRLTNIDPSTPEGLSKAVALGASECFVAARKLDEGFSDQTGEYILAFHAIELGLKAFLIKHGVAARDLRKKPYRHDLVVLHKAAKTHGLSLSIDDVDKMLEWINEWHNDQVKIRYEFTKERTLPMCATLFPMIEANVVFGSVGVDRDLRAFDLAISMALRCLSLAAKRREVVGTDLRGVAILAGMARPRIVDRDIGAAKAGRVIRSSYVAGTSRRRRSVKPVLSPSFSAAI